MLMSGVSTARDVFRAMRAQRMTFAVPLVLVLLIGAGIFAFLALFPAISPFVYPLL